MMRFQLFHNCDGAGARRGKHGREVGGEDEDVLVHGEDGLRMVSHEHRNYKD